MDERAIWVESRRPVESVQLHKQNLHDFRYEGGAPIISGFQIPVVIDKKEYGIGLCFVGCQRLRVFVLGGGSFAAFACYR